MAQRSLGRDRDNQLCDRRFKRVGLIWTGSANSHPGPRRVSRIKGRTHVSTRPRAGTLLKISLAPKGASTHGAKFWRLPRVEHAGGICASEPEVAHDPERPCREAEAPIQRRFQGPPFRSDADPAGRLQAVSWYLRYPLSYRDIEELLLERGLEVDHATLNRWVLAYAPLIERRLRPFRKPHCGSIRVDETSYEGRCVKRVSIPCLSSSSYSPPC
jgi:hypothetical protein